MMRAADATLARQRHASLRCRRRLHACRAAHAATAIAAASTRRLRRATRGADDAACRCRHTPPFVRVRESLIDASARSVDALLPYFMLRAAICRAFIERCMRCHRYYAMPLKSGIRDAIT